MSYCLRQARPGSTAKQELPHGSHLVQARERNPKNKRVLSSLITSHSLHPKILCTHGHHTKCLQIVSSTHPQCTHTHPHAHTVSRIIFPRAGSWSKVSWWQVEQMLGREHAWLGSIFATWGSSMHYSLLFWTYENWTRLKPSTVAPPCTPEHTKERNLPHQTQGSQDTLPEYLCYICSPVHSRPRKRRLLIIPRSPS